MRPKDALAACWLVRVFGAGERGGLDPCCKEGCECCRDGDGGDETDRANEHGDDRFGDCFEVDRVGERGVGEAEDEQDGEGGAPA